MSSVNKEFSSLSADEEYFFRCKLDEIVRAAVVDWLSESGPDDYYEKRLRGPLIGPVEYAIGEAVKKFVPMGSLLVEPGTGFGQLAIYLSMLGYPVIAFESGSRYQGAVFVANKVRALVNGAPISLINGWYPDALDGRTFDALVASNVANTGWIERVGYHAGRDAVNVFQGKPAIIDAQYWGRERNASERVDFECELMSHGCQVTSFSTAECTTILHVIPPKEKL